MLKRVILLGRKFGVSRALDWLRSSGIDVPLVVGESKDFFSGNIRHAVTVIGDDEIYRLILNKDPRLNNIDLVISYLHNKKILPPLYNLGWRGCINFHPAILPDYKSSAGYNTALLA